ncbi:MAG: GGDEF domain-containing phosphodiesterase [Acidobacteriota bacterium]
MDTYRSDRPADGTPSSLDLDGRLELAIARAARFGGRIALLLVAPALADPSTPDRDVTSDAASDPGASSASDHEIDAIARHLARRIRRVDFLAHLDGCRFAVVKSDLQVPEHAATMARRLIEGSGAAQANQDDLVCGIAVWPPGRADRHSLLQRAELALELARRGGPGSVRFDDLDVDLEVQRALAMGRSLDGAWQRDELFLELQPQVDLVERRIDGVEALVRWRHPEQGRLGPARFLGLAERTGLLGEIGDWVLRSACREARRWQNELHLPVPVAINLADSQLADHGFSRRVADVLDTIGLVPHALELEVTEDLLACCSRRATLNELAEAGVRLTLDDFGSGRSSLVELRALGFRKLKLDPVLVRRLPQDRNAEAVVRATIAVCRHLGLEPVAEGVESAEQMNALIDAGCPQALGFHLAPPLAPAALRRLVREGNERIRPWRAAAQATDPREKTADDAAHDDLEIQRLSPDEHNGQ